MPRRPPAAHRRGWAALFAATERGFDFFRFEAAAGDSCLVGHDEHQVVVHGAEFLGHVGQKFDYDVAVGVERNLALLVELDQRAA